MITATALDLIKLSLKMASVTAVGQTPLVEDVNDVFRLLCSMISSWSQKRWFVYHLLDIAHHADASPSYTVGPGGDFDVVRPTQIQSAYIRLIRFVPSSSGPTDVPLFVMQTHEEWGHVRVKALKSFPSIVFYDPTWPLGTLYVWPVPNDLYEIHIIIKDRLTGFASLTTPILLPEESYEALLYNLTARVQMLFSLPVNPGVVALAKAGLNALKIANHRVGELQMPAGLARGGGWPSHGVGGVFEGVFTLDEDNLG